MNNKEDSSYDSLKLEKKNDKANWNIKPYLAVALLAFIVFCFCILVFFFIYRFSAVKAGWNTVMGVLQPIIIGIVLAYILNPVMKFIERHLNIAWKSAIKNEEKRQKLCRVIGTAGALLFFILIIFLLIEMLVPQLVKSISGVVTTLPGQVDNFVNWFDDVMRDNKWAVMIEDAILQATDYLENWFKTSVLPDIQTYAAELTSGVISVVNMLLNILIGMIVSVYLLLSKEKFIGQAKKIIYAILPIRSANIVIETVHKSNEIFGGFISGKILDSAIIGVLCYIVLAIMHMPYAVLVSVIVGFTNVIPFFGPFIGAIPSFIIIALASPIQGLYFLIFIVILQQIDGNIIGPKILGDSTGLSSFWVLFAILVGGGLFGFAGMILGVPTFAVIYYIISRLVSFSLKRKKLPELTKDYTEVTHIDQVTNHMVYNGQKTQETAANSTEEEKNNKK